MKKSFIKSVVELVKADNSRVGYSKIDENCEFVLFPSSKRRDTPGYVSVWKDGKPLTVVFLSEMKGYKNKLERTSKYLVNLMDRISEKGGVWVSAGGGTINVAAGVIGRELEIPWDEAWDAIWKAGCKMNGEDWYVNLALNRNNECDEDYIPRWNIEILTKLACKRS